MTSKELDRLEALAAKATRGPWKAEYHANNAGCPTSLFFIPGHNLGESVEMLADDAAFIAASREAVPALVRRVRELEGQIAIAVALGGADAIAWHKASER